MMQYAGPIGGVVTLPENDTKNGIGYDIGGLYLTLIPQKWGREREAAKEPGVERGTAATTSVLGMPALTIALPDYPPCLLVRVRRAHTG